MTQHALGFNWTDAIRFLMASYHTNNYISESMGHAVDIHTVTQMYLDSYPLEKQMEYNSKLLNLKPKSSTHDSLMAKLADLSDEELAELLAKR